MANLGLWIVFTVGIVAVLALDLGLFNRHAHEPSIREAGVWALVWVALATAFGVGVFVTKGAHTGMQYTTGYLIELSLSVDNVFLFAVVFRHFAVPRKYQHRVLFWGIVGAVVMRGVMIVLGAALLARFMWITIVFGAFLIFTGIRMFLHRHRETDVSDMAMIRWVRRVVRMTDRYDGERFFTVVDGLRYATPLFMVLALVELTDLMFALDSIPAVFAITRDPFVVFTSNIFAILGLRSFYFLLAGVMGLFEYLTVGLSAVLVFVGVKMLGIWHIPTGWSLTVIVTLLGASMIASLIKARSRQDALESSSEPESSPPSAELHKQ